MARKWTCGFELQSVAAGIELDSTTGTAPTIDTGTVRSGAASIKFNPSANTSYFTTQFTALNSTNNFYIRFYAYFTSFPSANSKAIALTRSTNNGNNIAIRMNTAGTIYLNDEQSGTQIGSTSSALSLNTWYRIEFSYVYSGGAANAYLNGTNFATGSGHNNVPNDSFRLGFIDSATGTYYADDIAINDNTGTAQTGLPGAGNLIRLSPNAAGDSNGFLVQVGGTAGSSNNFTRVNETTPDDATTYNGAALLNAEDLFNVTDSGIGASDTVNSVSVGVRFADITGADATAAFKIEIEKTSGGTKTQSSAILPNSTTWRTNVPGTTLPKTYPLITYTDPDGAAWTQATLDTMQIGYIQSATNVQTIAISTIWVYVDYTPAAGGTTVKQLAMLGVG